MTKGLKQLTRPGSYLVRKVKNSPDLEQDYLKPARKYLVEGEKKSKK